MQQECKKLSMRTCNILPTVEHAMRTIKPLFTFYTTHQRCCCFKFCCSSMLSNAHTGTQTNNSRHKRQSFLEKNITFPSRFSSHLSRTHSIQVSLHAHAICVSISNIVAFVHFFNSFFGFWLFFFEFFFCFLTANRCLPRCKFMKMRLL